MKVVLNRVKVKEYLTKLKFRELFVEVLGWDHGGEDIKVTVSDHTFLLRAIAHKRGMVAY